MALCNRPILVMQLFIAAVCGLLLANLLDRTAVAQLGSASVAPEHLQVAAPAITLQHAASARRSLREKAKSKRQKPVKVARHEMSVRAQNLEPAKYANSSANGPMYLDYVSLEQATPAWREAERRHTARLPTSIYHPAAGDGSHNTGYIMVAITSCCRSWNMTELLIRSLIAMDDPIHVVLFDDNSKDGAPEKAAAMGIPVFTTGRMTGNSANMNRAWKYFSSYASLQTIFIMNNDIQVAPGSFSKLHRCAMSTPDSGVVGPMSDENGVGTLKFHITDGPYAMHRFYKGLKAPKNVRYNLPGTLVEYNAWLSEHTEHSAPFGKVFQVGDIFGFFMGFRKDYPVSYYRQNTLLQGGLNLGQEQFMFRIWRASSYVCTDVFVYHIKGATLLTNALGVRGVLKEPVVKKP